MTVDRPRFCSSCGAPLVERMIAAERRTRLVCGDCGTVAYRNPPVLVSTIVAAGAAVLLCQRAEEPAVGRWALPGGFLECNETLEEAAVRETFEETGIRIEPSDLRLHAVSTLPEINEVYVGFRAVLADPQQISIGPECRDVRFFAEDSVPWTELAFSDIVEYLRLFFREWRCDQYAIHLSRLDAAGVVSSAYRISHVEETRRSRSREANGAPQKLK